jgi:hypothetical protein
MSKMAYLKATRGAAGGLPILAALGGLVPKVLKVGGKLLGLGKKAAAVPAVQQAAKLAAGGAGYAAAAKLMGGGGSGASGSWGARRKGRGITATELRGFNKVAGLLHRVGMVPRKARGYKKSCR